MQFVYFKSMRVGINLYHVYWYSVNDTMKTLSLRMVSGQNFFLSDEDEISYFFDVVMLMELDEDEE